MSAQQLSSSMKNNSCSSKYNNDDDNNAGNMACLLCRSIYLYLFVLHFVYRCSNRAVIVNTRALVLFFLLTTLVYRLIPKPTTKSSPHHGMHFLNPAPAASFSPLKQKEYRKVQKLPTVRACNAVVHLMSGNQKGGGNNHDEVIWKPPPNDGRIPPVAMCPIPATAAGGAPAPAAMAAAL